MTRVTYTISVVVESPSDAALERFSSHIEHALDAGAIQDAIMDPEEREERNIDIVSALAR